MMKRILVIEEQEDLCGVLCDSLLDRVMRLWRLGTVAKAWPRRSPRDPISCRQPGLLRRIWVVAGAVGAWRGRADAPTGQFPSLSAPRPLGEAVRPEKNREDWRGGSAANAPRSYRHPGC